MVAPPTWSRGGLFRGGHPPGVERSHWGNHENKGITDRNHTSSAPNGSKGTSGPPKMQTRPQQIQPLFEQCPSSSGSLTLAIVPRVVLQTVTAWLCWLATPQTHSSGSPFSKGAQVPNRSNYLPPSNTRTLRPAHPPIHRRSPVAPSVGEDQVKGYRASRAARLGVVTVLPSGERASPKEIGRRPLEQGNPPDTSGDKDESQTPSTEGFIENGQRSLSSGRSSVHASTPSTQGLHSLDFLDRKIKVLLSHCHNNIQPTSINPCPAPSTHLTKAFDLDPA